MLFLLLSLLLQLLQFLLERAWVDIASPGEFEVESRILEGDYCKLNNYRSHSQNPNPVPAVWAPIKGLDIATRIIVFRRRSLSGIPILEMFIRKPELCFQDSPNH